MKTRILIIASLIMLAGCQPAGYREVPDYSIEQFLSTTSYRGRSFSSDETRLLYSSNETGIYNVYSMSIADKEVIPITSSTENAVFGAYYFPNDDRILYRGDQGGNEIWHIYLRDPDGTVSDLTPGDEARSLFFGWSHDGNSFYYTSNRRDPKYMDVYVMDIGAMESALIYENGAGYNLQAYSIDGRFLAFGKTITRDNSDIYLYDRENQTTKHLTPHDGDINFSPMDFDLDSQYLYYLTDEGREFNYLRRYNLASGESDDVLVADWGVSYAYFSHNGKYFVTSINEDAQTKIQITEVATDKTVKLPALPAGSITGLTISRSENLMAFYHSGATSPADIYVYDFRTQEVSRMTHALSTEINADDLVDIEVVRYISFDGLEIPALLYKPRQLKRGEKAPALVSVHGGPGGQSRVGYNALNQYLANHGYVVLAVNNRGSSGYGKTFYGLDDRKHGEDDLDDCVWAKNFLAETGYVDTSRTGIIGGSYGGYMTLAALTFRPTAFACGVDLFGISNWVRTLESIPPWWEAARLSLYRELGDPAVDKEMLYAKSPLFHVDQIVRPLIVLQGANDPRVIKPESDDILAAVRANGIRVEYVVFDDEGHGFVKKKNQITANEAILKFLNKYLMVEGN